MTAENEAQSNKIGRNFQSEKNLSLTKYSGIIEYKPEELYIKVKAGTPIKDIVAELDKKYIECGSKLITILNSINILSRMYYPHPLHKKSKSVIETEDFKFNNTALYSSNLFLLPSGWQMKKDQIVPIMILLNRIIDDIYS